MLKSIREIDIPSEKAMTALAKSIAGLAKISDVILLEGDIGAGKSFFSRAFIRHLCGEETEVPSPTFTLIQTYQAPNFEIFHCDLYRASNPDEVIELGLDIAFEESVSLVEWPDRLGAYRPNNALEIKFEVCDPHRKLEFFGNLDWADRLDALNA